MSEKVVAIYVTKEFRGKIKKSKRELTYEQYFDNLIKNSAVKPSQDVIGKNIQSTTRGDSS